MHIKIGRRFGVDTEDGLYIKVGGLGAGHRPPGGGWVWDRWSDIKKIEKQQEERRRELIASLDGGD
jgi:hypothetical protein